MRVNETYVPLFGTPRIELAKHCFLWNPDAGLLVDWEEPDPGEDPYHIFDGAYEHCAYQTEDDMTWMDLLVDSEPYLWSGCEYVRAAFGRYPFGWIACINGEGGYDLETALKISSGLNELRQSGFRNEPEPNRSPYFLALERLLDGDGTISDLVVDPSNRPDLNEFLPFDPETGLVADYGDEIEDLHFCWANDGRPGKATDTRLYGPPSPCSHVLGTNRAGRKTIEHAWRRCEQRAGLIDGYTGLPLGKALAERAAIDPYPSDKEAEPIEPTQVGETSPIEPSQGRDEDGAWVLVAEALTSESAVYDAVTGMTLIPDVSYEPRCLHGFMVAKTPLATLVGEGGGTPADAMDYALSHCPAPGALGGMGFIPEDEPAPLPSGLDAAALVSRSTSAARVLEIMGDGGRHRWSLSDPEAIAVASGIEDRDLFGVADLMRHAIDISRVPDMRRMLDDCDEGMRNVVGDWETQEGAIEYALGRLGLGREEVEL